MPVGMIIVVLVAIVTVGIALMTIFGLARALPGGDEVRERLNTFAAIPEITPRRARRSRGASLLRLRVRLNSMLAALSSKELQMQIVSANWPVSVTEFILIRIGITIASFLVGWLFGRSILAGIGLGGVAYLVVGIYLQRAVNRRRLAFGKQLVDVLVLIKGAVLAGFSMLQAMEVVVKEMAPPASEEFRRVQREVGLGISLTQALDNLSERMQNRDLDLLVTSVKIHHKVGGNLATMITAVTETIRDRVRLFSEIRVITTQQRFSSYIISLLPFFIGVLLFFLNPEYIMRLFEPGMLCVPIGALIGVLLGHFSIRRITKLEV